MFDTPRRVTEMKIQFVVRPWRSALDENEK
jgi:hypothetical protein